eukprot:Skav201628  [mRNA]  locus=scaffold3582:81186:86553:+ [translate_table: standard]
MGLDASVGWTACCSPGKARRSSTCWPGSYGEMEARCCGDDLVDENPAKLPAEQVRRFDTAFAAKKLGAEVTGNLQPHPAAHFHEKFKTRYIWTDRACLDAFVTASATAFEPIRRLAEMESICQALSVTKKLSGVYMEIGIYKGDASLMAMAYLARTSSRKSYFLDTFEGFNYPEARKSAEFGFAGILKSWATPELAMDAIRAKLQEVAVSPFELRVCNILRDELPDDPEIAVAFLDVDTYEPTLAGLRKLQKKVVVGGLILLDDAPATPKLAGALLALHEFLDEYEDQFVKMLWTGVYALLRIK